MKLRKRVIPKKQGMEKAAISALLVQKKSFALQRLMHDYNEITKQTVPIPGVSALPLDDDFYEWHGNVKAITNNAYKGAVLHFKLVFPKDYPLSPPTVYLLNTNLEHPNVVSGNRICLDMFEKDQGNYKGWKTGYTVLSILLQLQNFFFDVDENYLTYTKTLEIKKDLISMNEYKCSQCKHNGSSNPYPPFPKVTNQNVKLSKEQYREEKKKEICCYLRKTNFEEGPLGLGISISKIPRTGEIKGITPRFDFIAFKTYTKERVRVSFNGEHFTHWFPLYFGVNKDKVINSLKKAISMIAKGNTKEFSPKLVLNVMPKFFNYICVNIIGEKVHNSSRAIEILIYVYRSMLLLEEAFPEIRNEANKIIDEFIKNPEQRIKEKTPSLGDLLVMLSLSDKKIEELLPSYIGEQMDRQIFWILQEIPEFQNLINSSEVDDIRAKVCFKCGITGQQLLLFYYYFMNKVIYLNCTSLEKFAEKLDTNFCCLTEIEIDKIRGGINKILKIDNYNDFYKFMEQKPPSKDELNKKLKQAFENSKLKKYHGADEVRYVPSEKNQVEFYFKRYEDINNFIQNEKLLPNENQKWKDALNNLEIVKEFKYAFPNKEMTPLDLIKFQREKYSESLFFDVEAFQQKKINKNNLIGLSINKNKFIKKYEDELIINNLTWRQLYLKLYLEDYCKFFPYIANFKQLYNLLDIFKDDIIHFVLYISNEGYLKSDFNYIRAILSKLTSIKYLELIFTRSIGIKLLKNIVKGISNAVKVKASIEHLKIIVNNRYDMHSSKDLNILTILDNMPSLKVLDVSDVTLDLNTILRIRNHLYYYKKITVLDLSNCDMDDEMSNELADGIMKAKALEKLYIRDNKMKKGLANILYNLAFQPSIKLIDISSNSTCDKKETSVSLHKLIKMSQTVDTIIANHISNLNKELLIDFYYAIGDSNNLVYLDLSSNGKFSDLNSLGSALAFNAIKNGSLSYLDISFCDINAERFKLFLKGLKVSEEDHIKWYGYQFNTNIRKETPDYFNKKFHCNLETLVLNGNDLTESVNYLDPKNSYMENLVKTFITQSPKLTTLILRKNTFNKYFLDSISEALKETNNIKYLSFSESKIDGEKFKSLLPMFYEPLNLNNNEQKKKENKKEIIQRKSNPNLILEELDLSNNLLGYSGIETLSNALKINSTIKKLNLFHNLFDVNGARRIGDVLKINNNLTELDIGYNRIKNAGFKYIISALKENNKKINLKYLGLKYNFINDKIFEEQMSLIEEDENINIDTIHFKNNSLTSGFLAKFYEDKFIKMKKKLNLDIFDVLAYMTKDKLERTVWIPVGDEPDKGEILDKIEELDKDCYLYDNSKLGIPLLMRKKRGRKTGKKKDGKCKNIFIEFIMPNSVNRMLKLGQTSKFIINGKARKVYKAGTKPDYLVVKKRKNP